MRPHVRRRVALPSHPIALAAVAFLSYAAVVELYYVVHGLAESSAPVATFFPPAGLAVVLFLGSPSSRWPVLVCALWAAEVTVDLLHGVVFWDCAIWGVANTVEPLVAALLVRRLVPPDDRRNLGSMRNLMVFLGSAVLAGPFAGATIALTTAPDGDPASLAGFWFGWWVGDAIGVLVVAPSLLVLNTRRRPDQSRGATLLGLVTLLTAITLGPVHLVDRGRGVYLLLPALVWVAFKGGPRTAAAAVLIVGLGANLATLWGYGPFVEPGSPYVGQINAQIFIGTVAFSTLFVTVLGINLIRRDKAEMMLRDQSRTDPLTGIGNRRMLFERLDDFRSTGLLESRDPIAFLLLDLDGFKEINDAFGHAAGDLVLRTTADRLARTTRGDEIVVRLGGDEFLVCLTKSSSPDEVRALASRLSSLLAEPIDLGARSVTVGASIGVADGLWEDFDPDEFLRRADEEMYSVKLRQSPRIVVTPGDAAGQPGLGAEREGGGGGGPRDRAVGYPSPAPASHRVSGA